MSWALRINVTLLPSTRGFSKAVNAELQGVERQAKASGKRAGDDLGDGMNTLHAESYVMVTLPADGKYYVHLTDTAQSGGAAYAWS